VPQMLVQAKTGEGGLTLTEEEELRRVGESGSGRVSTHTHSHESSDADADEENESGESGSSSPRSGSQSQSGSHSSSGIEDGEGEGEREGEGPFGGLSPSSSLMSPCAHAEFANFSFTNLSSLLEVNKQLLGMPSEQTNMSMIALPLNTSSSSISPSVSPPPTSRYSTQSPPPSAMGSASPATSPAISDRYMDNILRQRKSLGGEAASSLPGSIEMQMRMFAPVRQEQLLARRNSLSMATASASASAAAAGGGLRLSRAHSTSPVSWTPLGQPSSLPSTPPASSPSTRRPSNAEVPQIAVTAVGSSTTMPMPMHSPPPLIQRRNSVAVTPTTASHQSDVFRF